MFMKHGGISRKWTAGEPVNFYVRSMTCNVEHDGLRMQVNAVSIMSFREMVLGTV
jgi:hypothetical protein